MNKHRSKKRIVFVCLMIVLVLGLLGLIYVVQVAPVLANQCRGNADSPIYKEATSLANEDILTTANEVVAQKIEKNKGYKGDVNCLYPLINYYMEKKEADKVKTLFGLYGLAYGDDKKAEKMYKAYEVKTYEDVKKQVEDFTENSGSVDVIYY